MCPHEPPAQRTDSPQNQASAADASPLSTHQFYALGQAVARHLLWGLPHSAHELSRWRRRASAIASPQLRDQALAAIDNKRPQAEGAALFAILPPKRNRRLLSLLVAYQVIWDYLDSVHEMQPDLANGLSLHQALCDAYEPHVPPNNYYQHHRQTDDGEYLHALTLHCRQNATRLASYSQVRVALQRQASNSALALSINHEPDAKQRQAYMRSWAKQHRGGIEHSVTWFELTAAAAAALCMFALLAEATNRSCAEPALTLITRAYLPWACSAATMLDSYADRAQDAANNQHIYIDYYQNENEAIHRTGRLIRESITRVKAIPRGDIHTVILASMVAMYLTRDSSRTPSKRQATTRLAQAGGTLPQLLIPILRTWRTIYHLRSV